MVGVVGLNYVVVAVVDVVGLNLCLTERCCWCSGWCCWTVSVCDRSRLLLRWLGVVGLCLCVTGVGFVAVVGVVEPYFCVTAVALLKLLVLLNCMSV